MTWHDYEVMPHGVVPRFQELLEWESEEMSQWVYRVEATKDEQDLLEARGFEVLVTKDPYEMPNIPPAPSVNSLGEPLFSCWCCPPRLQMLPDWHTVVSGLVLDEEILFSPEHP